jgi:hypothetical protein
MVQLTVDEEWEEPSPPPDPSVVYPPLTRATRRGRPLPKEVHRCCGFVAASVRFPDEPEVHRYDRVYPSETVQEDATGKLVAVRNAAPVIRNDPALARNGVARLVRCIPLCSATGSFHEVSTGFAAAKGAVACGECWS